MHRAVEKIIRSDNKKTALPGKHRFFAVNLSEMVIQSYAYAAFVIHVVSVVVGVVHVNIKGRGHLDTRRPA